MNADFANRFYEIDSLRGIAIILMIISNFVTDIAYFRIYNINTSSDFWWLFARITASMFMLLVGISLTLSYSKENRNFMHYLKRGLKIFSWGLAITAVTWLFIGKDFVIFGVLHLIGISIILSYPLIKRTRVDLLLGASFIAAGIYLSNLTFKIPELIWLGFAPQNFTTVDYFPIFPWFGVVLIGLFLGNALYANYKRNFKIPDLGNLSLVKGLCFLGRNSLLIYLIHQPVLIGLLHAFVM